MSGFIPARVQHALVACPWAKADPKTWATRCEHKPWKDIRSFFRHHVINSHRNKNGKPSERGYPDPLDDQVFKELADWSAKRGKKWKTENDQRARWYEAYNIIVRNLSVSVPDDVSPEWSNDWFCKVVNQLQAADAVELAISDEEVRRETRALSDRIEDKKKAIRLLQDLEVQLERELGDLKTQLRNKVRLHHGANEFLSQIDPSILSEPMTNEAGQADVSYLGGNHMDFGNNTVAYQDPRIAQANDSTMEPELFRQGPEDEFHPYNYGYM